MRKLSFIKGLAIGTIFSTFFWLGAYHVVCSITEKEDSQEQKFERSEVNEVKASF